jgi:predicted DNA-binding transcriptional regulator AlpA
VDDDTRLVSISEACRLLGVKSRNTIWSWRRQGHLPEPVNIGPPGKRPVLRYRRDLIEALARGGQS